MSEIFFSPITAVLENKAPGTLITGQPGGGKTFCMVNMAASCIEQGCNIFSLDAKNDMMALKNLFPDVRVTDVNNIAPGSLDPFIVFRDIDSASILTIVEILCGGTLPPEQRLAVSPIISDFVNRARISGTATFRDFAQYLYQHQNPQAQIVGDQLMFHTDVKYGDLIFGTPGKRSRAVRFGHENRIISIFGMTLPTDSRNIRPDEMISSAIVYIICKMMKEILTRKKKNGKTVEKRPTVLFLDECHMLMRSGAITDIIDEILVLGRSLGVSVVMASQNVTHFNEKIAQLVSTKISFKMSKREASEFFSMFNNTTSENELDVGECIEITTRLKTGYCFFIDSSERCVLMHVTSPYDQGDITSNPLFKKS